MNKSTRVFFAGLLGGVVMFVWGAVSYQLLPIGEMGVQSLPNEAVLAPMLKENVPGKGLYFFPAFDDKDQSAEAAAEFEKRIAAGPNGILVINPGAGRGMTTTTLGMEFGSNVVAAMLCAMLLSRYCGGVVCRTVAGAAIGGITWLSLSVSYWNWYEFPTDFTIGQGLGEVIGWGLTGLAIALVLPKGCGCAGCKCGTGAACGSGTSASQPIVGV